MNRFIRKILPVVATILVTGNLTANAQRNITIGEADLPMVAKTFLDKHFAGTTIHEFEKKFWSNSYELELADGTDIDFDSKGRCTEVSAPDHMSLNVELVKDMLPAAACKTLSDNNLLESVEEIEYSPTRGYKVEVRHATIDDYLFNSAGRTIKISYDD